MHLLCNGTKLEQKNNQMAEKSKTVCCSEGVTPQNFGFTMDIARVYGKSCVNDRRKVSLDCLRELFFIHLFDNNRLGAKFVV